jgi:hypothetical protein
MHNVRRPAAENRVVAVLAFDREASGAALLKAVELAVAEVPTPRSLAEVAAHRRPLANLRCGSLGSGVMQHSVLRFQQVVAADVGKRCQAANVDAVIRLADIAMILKTADREYGLW